MIVKTKDDFKFVQKRYTPIRNKLLNKHSEAEKRFEKLLIESGLYFKRERCNFRRKTRWCYFDFYIPFYNLYIEIDGTSHKSNEQKQIDNEKEDIIKWQHKFIVRLTNEQVFNLTSVDIDMLLLLSFDQRAAKTGEDPMYCLDNYWDVVTEKRIQGERDMIKTANFKINKKQKIWLYDNEIGSYFCFKNIFKAKFNTELSVNEIHALCELKEYKHNLNRRYVFAYTLKDCELRVAQTYY